MERRVLVKNLLLLGLSASLPLQTLFGRERRTSTRSKRPFHQFRLGELELTVVTDGHLLMSPVQPFFAPGIAPKTVEGLLQDSFRSTKEIDLGMNILVIRKGKQVILVDTGTGYSFGSGSGWLPQSLADAGFRLEEITDVVLSHAHPDHLGGLLNQDGSLVFPQAQIYLSSLEHKFWMADNPDFSKSRFTDKEQIGKIAAGIRQTLRALDKQLHLFEHPAELFGCLRLERAAGHTPGHTLVHVFSGQEEMVHIADLLHSDVLLCPHPEWGFYGDTDFILAATTRKQVLASLAGSRKKIFAYHLAWPGIGHVRKKGNGFEWIAETYPFPG